MSIGIPTKALLAFLFVSEKSKMLGTKRVSLDVLEKLAIYLSNNLPGYVFYDTSIEALEMAIDQTSVRVREYGGGKEVVSHIYYRLENNYIIYNDNGYSLNIDYYLAMYPEYLKDRLIRVIDSFFENRIYEAKIVLLCPILA